jgi:cytosine/uracil/thiamine/allantoin permease
MKNIILKIALINVLIAIVLLIVFYFSAFLSGYGSNASYVPQEKKLFVKFMIFHFVAAVFLLYRYKQINLAAISTTILVMVGMYLLAAWQFEYFS